MTQDQIRDDMNQLSKDIDANQAKVHATQYKFNAELDNMKKLLLVSSVDEYIAEQFDEDFAPIAKWECLTSYKIRKCLVSDATILPLTKAYQGTVRHSGRVKSVWISKEEFMFRKLKGEI